MVSYYHEHEGNLHPGDIAKAEDINQIQRNIKDAIRNLLEDLHERQGCIIGDEENAFVLTPETKRAHRFIDQMNLAEGNDGKFISIREIDYRQPLKMSRSSLYSVIVKMQNKSEKAVSVVFELHDVNENLIEGKRTVLSLPAYTEPTEYEIVFDLDYYPTAHGLDHEDLEDNNPQLLIPRDLQDTEGIDHGDEQNLAYSSLGASEVFLVVKALNKNKFDVNQTDADGYIWNDDDPTFGILMNINSDYGQLLEEDNGSGFVQSTNVGDLYFKTIYSNAQAYHCEYGEALIGGDKVCLADTHVAVNGASNYGDVVSYIYMDIDGHLKSVNTEPFIGTVPPEPIVDEPHLHIANIYTFADPNKEPIIYQDDTTQETRPRSHHERLRRLEKQMKYTQDIAIPPRLKYTLSTPSWIDENPEALLSSDKFNSSVANTLDALTNNGGYVITTDSNGNFIVKVTQAQSFNIPITLKSTTSGIVATENKNKILKSAQTSAYMNSLNADDITRAQTFSEIKNMKIDITNGIMTLDAQTDNSAVTVATTSKQAKETEFNIWDDSAKNRPKSSDIKPTTRSYTVTSGKNGKNDWASEYPGMTFYTSTNYKLKKLEIPIYKFKNCTGVKFIIYRRQKTNNKKNTVWLQKRIHVTDVFSLKKAKVKNGYQYMDNGFTIDFGKKGLTLSKGQYVIIALPIVKSGKGTVYVDTYKPADSKDFCIRYYGAANASHFLLKSRYQEIWYNSTKAIGEEIAYNTEGSVTSGTTTWSYNEPIKSIKPLVNITTPTGTSCILEVDVGSGWQKLTLNEVNEIESGKDSFRWRITFKGNKKETPTIKYDADKKYAIDFEIIRAMPDASNIAQASELDKNLCVTSKPFDGNNILREYLGDGDFALTDNKLSNYEFARVWATDNTGEELRIDLSGSDNIVPVSNNGAIQGYYTEYSLHYVDLTLDDFNSGSVDYSNYDPNMEIDEHNLRLKIDTDHSYNDNNIQILNLDTFQPTKDEYALSGNNVGVNISRVESSTVNNTLLKAQLTSPINLAQYDAIRIGLSVDGEVGGYISGLALYVSSTYETETPSNIANEPDESLVITDTLPDLNSSQAEVIDTYANQIVKRYEPRNGTAGYVYYQSKWDSIQQKWVWELLHNVKSYNIYELVNRSTNQNRITITADNQGQEQYYEINIDPNQINLQYAKEIGLIILNDENKYAVSNVTNVKLHEIVAIQQDYYPIFQASAKDKFVKKTSNTDTITKTNASGSITNVGTTTPESSQIIINYKNGDLTDGGVVASFDATSKNTKNYNHIGIQMASDCLIVKDMLELHLIKVNDDNTEQLIDKVRLPTNNYMYYATVADKNIKFVQVFKKLETNERFDRIDLVVTSNFNDYALKLRTMSNGTEVNGIDNKKSISLFIGNISLYQARTIPMFHPRMRMKFYFDQATKNNRDHLNVRKIGVVADYQ